MWESIRNVPSLQGVANLFLALKSRHAARNQRLEEVIDSLYGGGMSRVDFGHRIAPVVVAWAARPAQLGGPIYSAPVGAVLATPKALKNVRRGKKNVRLRDWAQKAFQQLDTVKRRVARYRSARRPTRGSNTLTKSEIRTVLLVHRVFDE